ncbi:MAG: hypothetical protein HYX39_00180 [Bacteroidetes bacterium]|nr:hypothetical protein [Bacteroidota bacterium]
MKKILLVAAVAGLTMVSCKKDRVCSCTTTSTLGSVSSSSTNDYTIVKESKHISKMACASKKSTQTDNGVTYTYESSCKLK